MSKKPVWTVFASTETDGGYSHLTLTFRRGYKCDAAEQVARAIREGWDHPDYYTDRAKTLRDKHGTTVFYDVSRYTEFSIRWQANTGKRDSFGTTSPISGWYGPHFERSEIDPVAVRAMARVSRVAYGLTPERAIETMRALGVRYCSDASVYVAADLDLSSPLDAARAESDPALALVSGE